MKLRFVTLNIEHGGKLFDEAAAFLKQQNADVVALQEIYNGTDPSLAVQFRSMHELANQLGYKHVDFAPSFRDFDYADGKAQIGNAVFSRFPIIAHDVVYFDIAYNETYRDVGGRYNECPRPLQHVTITTPAGAVDVYNVHGPWNLAGDAYDEPRQKMAAAILSGIQGKKNIILAGDTNANQHNRFFEVIGRHLHNVFEGELTTSFNMQRKTNPGYATAVVDTVCVSRNIRVLEHACPAVDVSDHLPLVASFDIPDGV